MRYLPLTPADRRQMLAEVGVETIDDLFAAVPNEHLLDALPDLPSARGEMAVERDLASLAACNTTAGSVPFFVGCGAYRHHVPSTVDHLIQRSEFLTSYTPYQPEITQGTLQYLFEFQTQVARLTGMDVANASMYDGSTATAEAVLMAERITRRRKAVLSGGLHPHYRDVIETLSTYNKTAITALQPGADTLDELIDAVDEETGCIVVQNPDFFGNVRDLTPLAEVAHAKGALLIVAVTEVVSLGAVRSPGEMGADIVTAEGQSIGNGLNFGGPYVGLFATRQKFLRQMPGRLCGETVDADGRRGFVLTLSTREQHIRREKATSNICTNSGLCALAFTIHLTLLGEKGLRDLANLNHLAAVALAERLADVPGVTVLGDGLFFNEFTVRLPRPAAAVVETLAARGILAGVPVSRLLPHDNRFENDLIIASTEINTDQDRQALADALKEVLA
jgi:glycine dehydrogenase subunit 1